MSKLRIVQRFKHIWQIENMRGDVILEGLTLESEYRAEEYIKRYISSFLCYTYEVIPLRRKDEPNS